MILDQATLAELWWAGVNAVRGKNAVQASLRAHAIQRPDCIIAVGKAAAAMALGALDHFAGAPIPTLVVTKYGHADADLRARPNVTLIEAAHPVPDSNSLLGGQAVREWVAGIGSDSHLLCLASGGASALAEDLVTGETLQSLQQHNTEWLARGLNIGQINARRAALSQIKAGKLLAGFKGSKVTVVGLSDVEGDSFGVIGSGLFSTALLPKDRPAVSIMAGSNVVARAAVVAAAQARGLVVCHNSETMYNDIGRVAETIAHDLQAGGPGLYIWGGEPTVILPDNPGMGGRNQALALALIRHISPGITGLVAGTDGTDGPTDAAGGFVAAAPDQGAAIDAALARADAYPQLRKMRQLFISGPTGTNVMDLAIFYKSER